MYVFVCYLFCLCILFFVLEKDGCTKLCNLCKKVSHVFFVCFVSTARCSSSHSISHNPHLLLQHFLIIPTSSSKRSVNSVNSVNIYSAVLPPSPMVFFLSWNKEAAQSFVIFVERLGWMHVFVCWFVICFVCVIFVFVCFFELEEGGFTELCELCRKVCCLFCVQIIHVIMIFS